MRQQKWCTGIYYEQILVQTGTDTMLLLVYKYQRDQGILARKGTATHHLFPYSTDHNHKKSAACQGSGRLGFVTALEIAAPVWRTIFHALLTRPYGLYIGGFIRVHFTYILMLHFLWLMLQVAWLVGAPALHLVALLRLWTEAQDVCASITICAWDQT